MAKHSFITLKALEADKDSSSVWVINRTNPRGVLNISMPDNLGGSVIMVIPVTWIPVDLTTQATKESLMKSPVFRRLVSGGNIGLIDEEQAQRIMESEDAKKEAVRVYSAVQATEELMNSATSSPEVAKLTQEESGNISGFAMNIVGVDLDEDQIMTMIRGQEGILTSADYKYIATNSPLAKVKEFCAESAVSA